MRLRTDEGGGGRTCPGGRIDGKHSCTSVSVLESYWCPFVPSEAWSSHGRFLSDAAPVRCQVCAALSRWRLQPTLPRDCRRTLDVRNLFPAATGKCRSKTNCEKWKRSYAPSCRVRVERDRCYLWQLGCDRSQPLLARDRSTQVQRLSRGSASLKQDRKPRPGAGEDLWLWPLHLHASKVTQARPKSPLGTADQPPDKAVGS